MWESINDKIEEFEQKHIIDPSNEFLLNKLGTSLVELGKDIWHWFVEVLPDVAGYGTIAAGVFIMVSPMANRGGMMKPLGFLAGGLIMSVCILMTN